MTFLNEILYEILAPNKLRKSDFEYECNVCIAVFMLYLCLIKEIVNREVLGFQTLNVIAMLKLYFITVTQSSNRISKLNQYCENNAWIFVKKNLIR